MSGCPVVAAPFQEVPLPEPASKGYPSLLPVAAQVYLQGSPWLSVVL